METEGVSDISVMGLTQRWESAHPVACLVEIAFLVSEKFLEELE